MPLEIELKLTIVPQDIPALRAHPLLKQWATHYEEQLLDTTYFDTPKNALRRSGYVLRIRNIGNSLIQTIKTSQKQDTKDGLHQRQEWEMPLKEFVPDFNAFPDPGLRQKLLEKKLGRRVTPLFRTIFNRCNWHLQLADHTEVLLSLDEGNIVVNELREPICEIEIELVTGNPDALQKIAGELSQNIRLIPENSGKAGRGYRLLQSISKRNGKK